MSFLSNSTKAAESSAAQPAVPSNAQQADVLGSAQQPASHPLSEMDVRKSGKRVLKVTRSEAIADIEASSSSDCTKRRKKRDLAKQVLSLPPERRSSKFAIQQWDVAHHRALFALTILMRALVNVFPELRDNPDEKFSVRVGSKRLEQSALFRPMLKSETCKFKTFEYHSFCKVLRLMHLHNPTAEGDHIHRITESLIWKQGVDMPGRVSSAVFFMEFAFLGRWLDARDFWRARKMSKKKFANYCWENGMVPITPRHGQGTNKSLHAQLKQCATVNNKKEFCRLLENFHGARMLTKQEARTIAAIVARPATDETNRISDVNAVLEKKPGYGDFTAKNLVEVLSVHKLLQHVTAAEWKSLKNGPGASRFLSECGISRADMLEYVLSVFSKFEQDDNLSVILPGGRTKHVPYAALKLPLSAFTERLVQYWSCAQGRILTAHQCMFRGHSKPVPYHLLPNAQIKKQIAEAFASGDAGDSDSESDWED